MRAVTIVDGTLDWREHPAPVPGTSERLVAVRAAGINSGDLAQRAGYARVDIVPIEQSERMAAALRGHQVPVEFISLPDEGHGFSPDAWPLLVQSALDFLGRTIGRAKALSVEG